MKTAKRLYLSAAIILLVSGCSSFNRQDDKITSEQPQQSVESLMQLPGAEKPQAAIPEPQPEPVAPTLTKSQTTSLNPDAKYKIGLLVPLSGRAASVGKQLFEAAQLAIAESGTRDFQVVPFDTASPEGAAVATDQALAQHVNIILGPLFSSDVLPVAVKAKAANIRVFSFSNTKTVANGNVYILGLVPDQQVNRVLKYAGDNHIKGFSAFLPDNTLGAQLSGTMKKLSGAAGGNVVKVQTYNNDTDSSARELSTAFGKKSITLNRRNQALLIPEGGERLPMILASLDKVGINTDSIRIIGTSFWDREDIITNSVTTNSWFVSTPYEGQDAFNTRFAMSYNYKPDDIASLGYDATDLAMESILKNYSDVDLKRNSGFKGVKGIYKFNKDNVDVRGYAIYEITNGGAHVIDPAPDHF